MLRKVDVQFRMLSITCAIFVTFTSMKKIFAVLILLALTINPIKSLAQNVDINHFYTSSFEPSELNRNEVEHIDSLLESFEQSAGNSSNLDAETFVYEYNYHLRELNRSGKIFYGDSIGVYLNELKDFILDTEGDRKRIKIYLIDEVDLNAFTNDFGNVYVHIGALARMKCEEELLFLLAHEISHVLLSHSRSTEERKVRGRRWYSGENTSSKAFSRQNERQADQKAIELLIDKIDLNKASGIFDRLEGSSNPILTGQVDFRTLTFGDVSTSKLLDSLRLTLNSTVIHPFSSKSEELSTHPSIKSRKVKFKSKIEGHDFNNVEYSASSKFGKVQLQANYLLLRSYMSSGHFIEGLDLVCKMRKDEPKDLFLIHNQLRFLVLISQKKCQNELFDQLIGLEGSSCNDQEFLKFKLLLLKLSNTDFNLLTLKSTRSALDQFVLEEKSKLIEKSSFQLLYINDPQFFELSDSTGTFFIVDSMFVSPLSVLDSTQNEIVSVLTDSTGLLHVEQFDTCFFKSLLGERHNLTNLDLKHIEEVKTVRESRASFVEGDQESESLILHPDLASSKYLRGIFVKDPNFDPNKKAVLVESSLIYLNSSHRVIRGVDYKRTVKLSEDLSQVISSEMNINTDLSNNSTNGITVYDNFIHGILQKWIAEKVEGGINIYSSVEDEIRSYLSSREEEIDYLVMNYCIVNKNKGKGRKHNLAFYQFYFDVELNKAVYVSAIGSKQRISKHQLRQFILISNHRLTHGK